MNFVDLNREFVHFCVTWLFQVINVSGCAKYKNKPGKICENDWWGFIECSMVTAEFGLWHSPTYYQVHG